MSETLKPCPLCNGGWRWFSNWSAPAGQQVHARCNGDDCGCAVYGESQQQVIDRINRRAPGPATAKMLVAAKWFRTLAEQWGHGPARVGSDYSRLWADFSKDIDDAEHEGQGVPR